MYFRVIIDQFENFLVWGVLSCTVLEYCIRRDFFQTLATCILRLEENVSQTPCTKVEAGVENCYSMTI